MAELTTRASCTKHPEQLAESACDHCGNPLCKKCSVEAVAADHEYCSKACRDAREADTLSRLLVGIEEPFTTGWRLWFGSLGTLVKHLAPITLLIAVAWGISISQADASDVGPGADQVVFGGMILALVFLSYGFALTGVVLSHQYTGVTRGNLYLWALRRTVPWLVTWFLAMVLIGIGYVALIVPGVILALRLFWADEFALAHNTGPIRSLKASWELTVDDAGMLFGFQFLSGLAAWLVVMAGFAALYLIAFILLSLGTVGSGLTLWLSVLILLVGYGAVHGPQLAKFYGMRAAQIMGDSSDGITKLGLRKKAAPPAASA